MPRRKKKKNHPQTSHDDSKHTHHTNNNNSRSTSQSLAAAAHASSTSSCLQGLNATVLARFIAQQSITSVENCDVVPVVGLTGSGKSTAINIQLGVEYRRYIEEKTGDEALEISKFPDSSTALPQTSSGLRSKTLHVASYTRGVGHYTYVDTAGLLENRGREEALWANNSAQLMFRFARSVQALIICFDYNATFPVQRGHWNGWIALARTLHPLLGSDKRFSGSLVFLIKGANKRGVPVRIEDMVRYGAETMAEQRMTLERMGIRHVSQHASKTATHESDEQAALRASVGLMEMFIDASGCDYKLVKCTRHHQQEFVRYRDWKLGQDRVAEVSAANRGRSRVYVATPYDGKKCADQRHTIDNMVGRAQKIDRKELVNAVDKTPLLHDVNDSSQRMQVDAVWTFIKVLQSLAIEFTPHIKQANDALRQLIQLNKASADLVQRIKAGWVKVRDAHAKKAQHEITRLTDDIKHLNEAIKNAEESHEERCVDKAHVTARREKSYKNLWGLFAYAGADYTYDITYADGTLVPFIRRTEPLGEHFSIKSEEKVPSSGKLHLEFESSFWEDLRVKFNVLAAECKLPETLADIAAKKREVASKEESRDAVYAMANKLQQCTDAQSLTNVLQTQRSALEHAAVTELFWLNQAFEEKHQLPRTSSSADCNAAVLRHHHVLEGMYHLVRVMVDSDLFSDANNHLSEGKQFMDDFVHAKRKLNGYLGNPHLKTLSADPDIIEFELFDVEEEQQIVVTPARSRSRSTSASSPPSSPPSSSSASSSTTPKVTPSTQPATQPAIVPPLTPRPPQQHPNNTLHLAIIGLLIVLLFKDNLRRLLLIVGALCALGIVFLEDRNDRSRLLADPITNWRLLFVGLRRMFAKLSDLLATLAAPAPVPVPVPASSAEQ
jgi:hypothetical protein